jgi:hypothetical protein
MEIDQEQFDLGREQSQQDIAAGTPKLFWQTRNPWAAYFTQLMAGQFSVEVVHHGDMVTLGKTSYWNGYNSITKEYIDTTFGPGSYQTALDDLERFRLDLYQKHSKPNE